MKVKYIKETMFMALTKNHIYEVMSIERKWYRIFDDSFEDYIYPPELFEIVDRKDMDELIKNDKYAKKI